MVSTSHDQSTAQVLAQVTAAPAGSPQLVSVDLLTPDELLSGMLTQVGSPAPLHHCLAAVTCCCNCSVHC